MAERDAKKQLMEYMAVGLLVLVSLFIGINRFRNKDVDDEVFSRKKFNEKWKEVEILEARLPKEEKEIKYALDSEESPFKSPIKDMKKMEIADGDIILPSMTFQGMIWNSARPQAIIDDKVYDKEDIIEIETGEIISEKIKIMDITRDGIYLRYKGKDFLVKPK